MQFVDIRPDDLLKLRDGLDILDRIREDPDEQRNIFLYGISTDTVLLDAAREAVANDADDPAIMEDNITLGEIAVAIPLSGDVIYALTGSGMKLDRRGEFAYRSGEGEGVRTLSFQWSNVKPVVTLKDFSQTALANDSVWLDRYLAQRGTNATVAVQKEVQRATPATPPPGAVAPAVAPQKKQTSLHIKSIVEDWLG
jgi:hypothetical protein